LKYGIINSGATAPEFIEDCSATSAGHPGATAPEFIEDCFATSAGQTSEAGAS